MQGEEEGGKEGEEEAKEEAEETGEESEMGGFTYEQLILSILQEWAHIGATREIFFTAIRGVRFDDLKRDMVSLQEKGFIQIDWLDLDRFEAYITESGQSHLEFLRSQGIDNSEPEKEDH
jgi:hypothetical protein